MINNKTYNNAIDTLKQLGEEHKQIATTTTGDIYDIDLAKNTLFPLFHINPVNVTTGQSTLTYNFQLFVMDLVSQKKDWTEENIQSADNLSNEQEVLSSCLQICVDVIGMMRHSKWQSAGTVDIDDPVYFTEGTGEDCFWQVTIDGEVIYHTEITSSAADTPYQEVEFILPAYATIQVSAKAASGTRNLGAVMSGRVYN